jgi:hypothetical protein
VTENQITDFLAAIALWIEAAITKQQTSQGLRRSISHIVRLDMPIASGNISLCDILETVRRAAFGERNEILFRASCRAGELIVARTVAAEEAVAALDRAARAIGISAIDATHTIRSGISRGGRRG